MLIVGRAVAGIGAAGLFSGALVIVSNMVPLRQRPSKSRNLSTVRATRHANSGESLHWHRGILLWYCQYIWAVAWWGLHTAFELEMV